MSNTLMDSHCSPSMLFWHQLPSFTARHFLLLSLPHSPPPLLHQLLHHSPPPFYTSNCFADAKSTTTTTWSSGLAFKRGLLRRYLGFQLLLMLSLCFCFTNMFCYSNASVCFCLPTCFVTVMLSVCFFLFTSPIYVPIYWFRGLRYLLVTSLTLFRSFSI